MSITRPNTSGSQHYATQSRRQAVVTSRYNSFILHNASIVGALNDTTRSSQIVYSKGSKIINIASAASTLPRPLAEIHIMDCTGQFLCLGLMNTHVHLIDMLGFDQLPDAFGNSELVSLLRNPPCTHKRCIADLPVSVIIAAHICDQKGPRRHRLSWPATLHYQLCAVAVQRLCRF